MLKVTNPVLRAVSGVVVVLSLVAIVLNYVWAPVQYRILPYALGVFVLAGIAYVRSATLVTCQVCGWKGAVAPWEDPRHCPDCRKAEDELAYRRP